MAVTIQSYFDGSGNWNPRHNPPLADKYLTLAGYAATPVAWTAFESLWAEMLARWPNIRYLHMADANALRGQYTEAQGWTKRKVMELVIDVVNNCLTKMGWGEYKDQFVGTSCTVNLEDYRRLLDERPGLHRKEPEAICVDHVVTVTLSLMPDDSVRPFGKDGIVELYFDRNESFRSKIQRVWDKGRKGDGVLSLVGRIGSGSQKNVAGLQAADLLAWYTNRSHTRADPFAKAMTALSCPTFAAYLDYPALAENYGHL